MVRFKLNRKRRVDVSEIDNRVVPNRYYVYRNGKIYSKKSGRYLTSFLRNQYMAIRCYESTLSLHRLLAQAFIKNPDPINNTVVDHIDDNKLNNTLRNLAWVTPSENIKRGHKSKRDRKYEPLTHSQKRILIDVMDKYPEVMRHEGLKLLMNV